jgi:peroxiredoxin
MTPEEVRNSAHESKIQDRILHLRALPVDKRSIEMRNLALEIRKMPVDDNLVYLALQLANHVTEGDFGRETLQAVSTTLEIEAGKGGQGNNASAAYDELADLVHFEGAKLGHETPGYLAAAKRLQAVEEKRRTATVSLKDLSGNPRSLADLKGKVVLVNFWATWCPPCNREMPDMEKLSKRFADKGFVVLAISNEPKSTVQKYLDKRPFSFTVLLDPGDKTAKSYEVQGIPMNFVYDRSGRLVAESIDMRTERQFLKMLAKAGLR